MNKFKYVLKIYIKCMFPVMLALEIYNIQCSIHVTHHKPDYGVWADENVIKRLLWSIIVTCNYLNNRKCTFEKLSLNYINAISKKSFSGSCLQCMFSHRSALNAMFYGFSIYYSYWWQKAFVTAFKRH